MNRWLIFVLFSILLSYPAVSGAAVDTFDTGRSTMFDYSFLKFPIGAGASNEKKGEVARDEDKREKDTLDKKVDDAIKKAWKER